MPISDKKKWTLWVRANKAHYGKVCVDVARRVMELLDEQETFDTHAIIRQADRDVRAGGITLYMAACVAQMITQCHSRGREFQAKWNARYGVTRADGTVNPAILALDT